MYDLVQGRVGFSENVSNRIIFVCMVMDNYTTSGCCINETQRHISANKITALCVLKMFGINCTSQLELWRFSR